MTDSLQTFPSKVTDAGPVEAVRCSVTPDPDFYNRPGLGLETISSLIEICIYQVCIELCRCHGVRFIVIVQLAARNTDQSPVVCPG